jgi:hypothetical protein
MSYKQAKGAIPWRSGDPSPEQTVRRIRGDHSECEAQIANLTAQVLMMKSHLELYSYHPYPLCAKVNDPKAECTCGLDEVLASTPEVWFSEPVVLVVGHDDIELQGPIGTLSLPRNGIEVEEQGQVFKLLVLRLFEQETME